MSNPIEGRSLIIDVSEYQGGQYVKKGWITYEDFKALRDAGVSGVIIRANYGKFTDPLFAIQRDAARSAGMLIGYYTFPTNGYARNWPFLLNKYTLLANLQDNDNVITATDWETSGSDSIYLAGMEQWQALLSKKIGRPVLTYTSLGMTNSLARGATTSSLSNTWLWAADYEARQQPLLPPFWKREQLALWQFRGGGDFGWPLSPDLYKLWKLHPFDVSAFTLGDETDLRKWWSEVSGAKVETF